MIGQKLGPYSIIEEIGSGGMATVYRAYQQNMNRDVAIKVIKKSKAENLEAVQRFQREAHLIARLEHIHILPIYDFDGVHNPPYIVMRYIDGGTLEEVMEQGAFSFVHILHLMRQICSATDYAHRQGIIHRDLKASNVMIDQERNIFVTDFGLARYAVNQPDVKQITNMGVAMGTPNYISPEQIRGAKDLDHRTDIYSLGVLLFRMLTGRMPYEGKAATDVMMMHLYSPVPSAVKRNQSLPDEIDEVIWRALAKRPEDRYETVADLSNSLTKVLSTSASEPISFFNMNVGASFLLRGDQANDLKSGTSKIPSKQYKTVTALFANASEYALLVEEASSAESAARNLAELWSACQALVKERSGTTLPQIDTELFALWGGDTIRENDAEQAVHTALQMQIKMQELGAPFFNAGNDEESLPINIGLDSGLVLLEPSEDGETFTVTGSTINIAHRLMRNASGKILVTQDVLRQVLGSFTIVEDSSINMRGRAQPVETYRILAAKPRSFRVLNRGLDDVETKMVGREAELRHLQKAHLNALEASETQVVTIVGNAGKGKSRILLEFNKWAELRKTYRIFYGRATAEMLDKPYSFIRDIISFRFQLADTDSLELIWQKIEQGVENLLGHPNVEKAHMIGQLCGFDFSNSQFISGLLSDPPQLVYLARQSFVRFIVQIAKNMMPVVFQLEDIHFADNDSLDLLNDLFLEEEALPLLVVCTARPSLFDRRAEWGSGQPFHSRINLKPLDKYDSRELLREILQKVIDIPNKFSKLLVNRAEGNPYFLEELVKMLIDDEVIIKQDDDQWEIQENRLASLEVPRTINGLLEARLDTLPARERLILQRSAILGHIFYDTALKAIDDLDSYHIDNLDQVLDNLVKLRFIYRRETSAFEGSVEYIFASNLLLDVILKTLLENKIKVYNLAAAEWLETIAGERMNEHLPLIAQYYDRGGDLKNAAKYLTLAGQQALRIGAYTSAREAFMQAYQHNPDDFRLLLGLGETTYRLSGIEEAQEYFQKAVKVADNKAQKPEILAIIGEASSQDGRYSEAQRLLTEALSLARESNNKALLSRVLYGLGDISWRLGETVEAIEFVRESLEIAREIGDGYRELFALNRLGTLTWVSDPVAGRKIFQEMGHLAQKAGNQERELAAIGNISFGLHLSANTYEDWQQVFQLASKALSIAENLGDTYMRTMYLLYLAHFSTEKNDPDNAKKYFYEGLKLAVERKSESLLSFGLRYYAYFVGFQGEIDQALIYFGLIRSSPEHGSDQDPVFAGLIEKLKINPSLIDSVKKKNQELNIGEVVSKILVTLEETI